MRVTSFPLGPIETNSYILDDGKNALSIDVGGDPAPILDFLARENLTLLATIITHQHFDHLYGVHALQEKLGTPCYCPKGDAPIENTESTKGGLWGLPRVPEFRKSISLTGKIPSVLSILKFFPLPVIRQAASPSTFLTQKASSRATASSTALWAERISPSAITKNSSKVSGIICSRCPRIPPSIRDTALSPISARKALRIPSSGKAAPGSLPETLP